MKKSKSNKQSRKSKRLAFRSNELRQKGHYIVVSAGVSRKVAKLIRTEAAISNVSVAAQLASILDERYAKV